MKKYSAKQQGMVFITMLLFISLISLLLIYMQQSVALQRRINHNRYLYLQSRQAARIALVNAYQSLKSGDTSCQQQPMSVTEILSKSNDWWLSSQTCHGHSAHLTYQYVVSHLQQDDCAEFEHQMADYWRITARASIRQQEQVILQATVVLPIQAEEACARTKRVLTNGWQSFRQLS
ncbi:MAG: hypothetical protein AAGA27_02670 [Pseudomonadota bacterium]